MKHCEFRECTFEENLNRELSIDNMMIFTPDRVLERRIGFDAAIFSRDQRLFRMFCPRWPEFFPPMPNKTSGIDLSKTLWEEFKYEINSLPINLKFNMFLQHKLPVFIEKNQRKIKNQWMAWTQGFFRYEITEHQHVILQELEGKFT